MSNSVTNFEEIQNFLDEVEDFVVKNDVLEFDRSDKSLYAKFKTEDGYLVELNYNFNVSFNNVEVKTSVNEYFNFLKSKIDEIFTEIKNLFKSF